ncbi:hypothetical protein NQ318_000930 [Aromia moschata]|uniref:Uncharacterized protein n=1 Tax=Aromia moschata TaxID=1265417 RepID=A0AAV8ZDL0_9CUCU|nr:hypothetical protein NQ318_000930 [Aromia moschata]
MGLDILISPNKVDSYQIFFLKAHSKGKTIMLNEAEKGFQVSMMTDTTSIPGEVTAGCVPHQKGTGWIPGMLPLEQ